MKFTLPIYVESRKSPGTPAPVFNCRALFVPGTPAQDPQLNRALNKLVKQLKRTLGELAREPRHERLLDVTFNPDLDEHRLELAFELRAGWQRVRLCVVSFRALDRRIAFSPSLPDVWFEVPPAQTLQACASRVYEQHFRQREKNDPDVRHEIAAMSLQGQAWLTTLEITAATTSVKKPKADRTLAALFGGEVADGTTELENVGRCLDWLFPDGLARAVGRDTEVEELLALLLARQRRPVLLLGPRQSGKSTVVQECVYRTVAGRKSPYAAKRNVWLLSPQRLIAGMSYLGQWEERLLAILKTARKRDHALYFDDLLGAYRAGVSRDSNLCVADVLKPYVERGEVRVVAEMTPEAWRVWRERDRGFADLFHIMPINETDERQTLRILISVMRQLEARHRTQFDLDVLPAVIELTRRYLRDASFPGKGAVFLDHLAAKFPATPVSRQTVHAEFAAKTGLGVAFSDRSKKLPREEVLDSLGRELIGQRAALESVADVVSIAKAQLNDPARPLASLLFVGPTGVGKTQLAKTLAGYLFGDAERLLRFDMNEFGSPGSPARLVGTFSDPEGLLTSAVRRQPFCVVLLDEIEKAHPDVFDLLLQVMGEGRLTDALGRTTDFGNAIVVLTSNLGTREAGAAVGFRTAETSDRAQFVRAAEHFFRPEFVNRLDRIVAFERLSRPEVRQIAELVIRGVFQREGLVRRKCVLEVDRESLDQVVDRGYHPTLGARALKREVERQLTQPVSARLAATRPDAATVVSLYPCPTGIAVQVQPLVDAAPARHAQAAANGDERAWCAERLAAVERSLARIEDELVERRPSGAIVRGEIPAEHFRYFLAKEQAARLRREMQRVGDVLQQSPRGGALPPWVRPLRRRGLAKCDIGGRRLLRELASVEDIHNYLKELAGVAARFGHQIEHQVEELLHEAALVEAMADFKDSTCDEAVLVLFARGNWVLEAPLLATWYALMFADGFSLDCRRLEGKDNWQPIAVGGPHALAVASVEQGTHLFCPKGANLVPVQVSVLPVVESSAEATVAAFFEHRRDWLAALAAGRAAVDDDPQPLLPVVRVYGDDGPTLDLRSGLSVPGTPTTHDLRTFLLAALEPPQELVEIC